jgi:hypothetical protein
MASDLFAHHFIPGKFQAWIPDKFMTYSALNIYNRYFYPIGDCTQDAAIPFGNTIDPEDVLSTMGATAGLIHTADNRVDYFKMTEEKKYSFVLYYASSLIAIYSSRIVEISPILFRVGDVVEAHLSIVVNSVKGNMHQMFLVLRGLALLDNKETLVCYTCLDTDISHLSPTECTFQTTCQDIHASSSVSCDFEA